MQTTISNKRTSSCFVGCPILFIQKKYIFQPSQQKLHSFQAKKIRILFRFWGGGGKNSAEFAQKSWKFVLGRHFVHEKLNSFRY